MPFTPFKERTDAKVRFARIHLEELKAIPHPLGGDDFNRAHQEAFLFQLLGARDCFWAELAARAGHPSQSMDRITTLRKQLKKKGVIIQAIEEMHALAQDKASWLRLATDLRNISAHDRGASRAYYLGGPWSQKVRLRVTQPTRRL